MFRWLLRCQNRVNANRMIGDYRLGCRFSVAEAEREFSSDVDGQLLPFGDRHHQWLALVEAIRAGDEVWTFTTSRKSWEALRGRSGILLVRGSEIVEEIVLQMN